MTTTLTLAQLTAAQNFSVQQIFQFGLATYQSQGFPVQNWQQGGVERTRLLAFSTMLFDVVGNYIPTYAGGSFLDYATGAWLQLTAQELYAIIYNSAVFTQGTIVLTSAAGVSSATYQAGQLKATFGASGLSYLNTGTIVVAAGPGSVSGTFQAENAGAQYADASNSGALTLTTPIPGVTLTNPASNFTSQTHVGSGTGTLVLGGSPIGSHNVQVTISATQAGGTSPSVIYTLDGIVVPLASVTAVGITITFVAGVSGTSWVQSDTYTFNTPGSWITQQGANQETDAALATRCRNKWATQSVVPTQSLYQYLATSTPNVGSQVTQVIVIPDGTINNKVNVVVAGPGGILPGTVITTLQAYLSPRARGCDSPIVVSPTTLNVTFAGVITCAASQLSAVQTAVQLAMTNYVNSVGINGTLKLSAIESSIVPNPVTGIGGIAGVSDMTGVTINGVASNLTLGSSSSFVLPSLQALGFTYVTT